MSALTKEHWLQILALGLTVVATIGSATWYLSNDIEGVRMGSQQASSVLLSRVAADEERINALERLENQHFIDESGFRTEMRAAQTALLNSLADVRVAVGAKGR
jgi:hypothetical protein